MNKIKRTYSSGKDAWSFKYVFPLCGFRNPSIIRVATMVSSTAWSTLTFTSCVRCRSLRIIVAVFIRSYALASKSNLVKQNMINNIPYEAHGWTHSLSLPRLLTFFVADLWRSVCDLGYMSCPLSAAKSDKRMWWLTPFVLKFSWRHQEDRWI